jgi:hypothetical protein
MAVPSSDVIEAKRARKRGGLLRETHQRFRKIFSFTILTTIIACSHDEDVIKLRSIISWNFAKG